MALRLLRGSLLAWSAWLLAVVFGLGGLLYGLELTSGPTVISQSIVSYVTAAILAIAFASVGLTIKVRGVGNLIGWLFIGIGVIAGFSNITWGYSVLSASRGVAAGPVAMPVAAWLGDSLLPSGWFVSITALALLFPDGRLVGPRWRLALAGSIAVGALLIVCLAVTPGVLPFYPFTTNPFGATGLLATLATTGDAVLLAALAAFALAAAWSVVVRYRTVGQVERQQLKWFAWAVAVVVVAGTIELAVGGPWLGLSAVATDLAWTVFSGAAVLVPVAALVAMTRYRLYEIDRLISRTFVYGALTALLAGLYAASIRVFTSLFVGVTGQTSDLALVLTTLVLTTSFTPLKGRLETIAGERFKPTTVPGPEAATPAPGAATASLAMDPALGSGTSTGLPEELEHRIEDLAGRVARETVATELARADGTHAPGS